MTVRMGSANPMEMIVKMLTHLHMRCFTWWCWHVCKEEEVGKEKVKKEASDTGIRRRLARPLHCPGTAECGGLRRTQRSDTGATAPARLIVG